MPDSINISGTFYPTYKAANPDFSSDTFRCAEETVAELLAKATTSDNPGMLLGKVQSGKTRTFISILALAFDNGFDIAIVLSKNSRALIEQTAKRLTSEFQMFIDDGELEIYAIDHPILFLLRQDGTEEKGWRGTPFYWPVIRAQARTPTAVYTAETID